MISIIIPTYNRQDNLARALRSVLAQTYKDFEVLVIDDGSTDQTENIVKDLAAKDNRIKYCRIENSGGPPDGEPRPSGGPAKPRNTGIEKARGEFIAFLDSDDEWLPEKLAVQIRAFENTNNPRLGLTTSDFLNHNDETGAEIIYKIPRKEIEKEIFKGSFNLQCSTVVVRREVFNAAGTFDEYLKNTKEDWDMWIRIADQYRVAAVYEPLVRRHLNPENISRIYTVSKEKRLEQLKKFEYLFEKNKNIFWKRRRIYALVLKDLGLRYVKHFGDLTTGRKFFRRALAIQPFSLRNIFTVLSSLFGLRVFRALHRLGNPSIASEKN